MKDKWMEVLVNMSTIIALGVAVSVVISTVALCMSDHEVPTLIILLVLVAVIQDILYRGSKSK